MQKEPLTAIGTYLIVMINFIYTQEVVDEIKKNNDLLTQMVPKRILERIGDGEPLSKLSEVKYNKSIK